MFFMFVIIFPANKDNQYSTLFPRAQRFMMIIASVAIVSGVVLTLVNPKFSIETLFGSSWGYAILTGATISIFVYMHILMQNRRNRTIPTRAAVSSSLLLIPSTSISARKVVKLLSVRRIVEKEKYQNDSSHGYFSFYLQLLLH